MGVMLSKATPVEVLLHDALAQHTLYSRCAQMAEKHFRKRKVAGMLFPKIDEGRRVHGHDGMLRQVPL